MFNAAVNDPVEHVLHRPGQLGEYARLDHPATALEGVKRAPHFSARLVIFLIGLPLRGEFGQGLQNFTSFFDENLYQFRIKFIVLSLRRCARRHGRGRHIRRYIRRYIHR